MITRQLALEHVEPANVDVGYAIVVHESRARQGSAGTAVQQACDRLLGKLDPPAGQGGIRELITY